MLIWCLMRKQLSSALNSTLWSPNSFTYLRTWLISLGKQNLSNLMRQFTFDTLSLLVCFPVFFFCLTIIYQFVDGFQVGMLYLKAQRSARQYVQVGTLVTSLSCIGEPWTTKSLPVLILLLAYILNLCGSDIPYNLLFHSYLFVSLDSAILFVESSKIHTDIAQYLKELNIQPQPYMDLWPFLRRREWGELYILKKSLYLLGMDKVSSNIWMILFQVSLASLASV